MATDTANETFGELEYVPEAEMHMSTAYDYADTFEEIASIIRRHPEITFGKSIGGAGAAAMVVVDARREAGADALREAAETDETTEDAD